MVNTPPTDTPSSPILLMLGDSLVAGFNWQDRLPGLAIRNYGVPGATTSDLLSSLSGLPARSKTAQLILVMAGTNDLLMEDYSFIERLKQIIVKLTTMYPIAEIMVNNLLPMPVPYLGDTAISRLNSSIEGVCRDTGSSYVDTCSTFLSSAEMLFQIDGVHLNSQGYEIWARTLQEHIAFLMESD